MDTPNTSEPMTQDELRQHCVGSLSLSESLQIKLLQLVITRENREVINDALSSTRTAAELLAEHLEPEDE